jgi:hypothetical protein
LPKSVLENLITIDLSFGKRTSRRKSIDWLNGVWFVDPKTKVGCEYMTFRLKTLPYWVNGFLSSLPKMVFQKPSLRESILAL